MTKAMTPVWLRPTTRVERALQDAQEHARQGGCELAQSEHVLIALVQEPNSFSTLILARLGISQEDLSAEIAQAETPERAVAQNERSNWPWEATKRGRTVMESLPASPLRRSEAQPSQEAWAANRAQMLDAGRREAQALGDTYVGTEHLLLALLQRDDISGESLRRLGVTRERAHAVLADLRGSVPA